jgi:hypothetical protein
VTAGYSGTPLPQKLGIREGTHVVVLGAPKRYRALLGELPRGATVGTRLDGRAGLVHLFVTAREELAERLAALRTGLPDATPIWVSWPKQASKVPTTVTETVVREVGLPLGFVDIKVCAVSEVWSGLKLVVRKELRRAGTAPP